MQFITCDLGLLFQDCFFICIRNEPAYVSSLLIFFLPVRISLVLLLTSGWRCMVPLSLTQHSPRSVYCDIRLFSVEFNDFVEVCSLFYFCFVFHQVSCLCCSISNNPILGYLGERWVFSPASACCQETPWAPRFRLEARNKLSNYALVLFDFWFSYSCPCFKFSPFVI